MPAQQAWNLQGVVHITGGGFPENIPRVVPKDRDLGFRIQRSAWAIPPLFQWLQTVRPRAVPPSAMLSQSRGLPRNPLTCHLHPAHPVPKWKMIDVGDLGQTGIGRRRRALFLMQAGNVEEAEMFRTFNMGVGMLVIIDKDSLAAAQEHDAEAFVLGEVVAGRGVNIV